jgi:aspartyl-tRNA(Asn)/glutamyl-tRNA(Gln) amidotransferase subunit A
MLPADYSIAEARRAIESGALSASELAESCLARIAARDPPLNVFRTVTAELARAQAARIDAAARRGDPLGPLAGIPVALKDNIAVAGVRLTAGSKRLAENVATEDAVVWQRLRDAGAVLVGKLHMAEWALGATTQNRDFGDARNPWDPERTAGGSSAGSAAAIASDMALVTLGTDTGGSIRIPASLNGCCGLRPTSGRVSNRGVIPCAWTFDTVGPLARRAEDVAATLAVIAGHDPHDPGSAAVGVDDYAGTGIEGLRVGVLGWTANPAADVFAGLGAVLEQVELPGREKALEDFRTLMAPEAAAYHAEVLRDDPETFAPDVLARLRHGAAVSGSQYARAREAQRVWTRVVLRALEGCDLLLAPGACGPAPRLADCDPLAATAELVRFTAMWSLARVPALSVPAGFADGLPVSVQLVGRPFDEATLLRAAAAYQAATDWHLRRPGSVTSGR